MSGVWEYFAKLPENDQVGKSNICLKDIQRKEGQTISMKTHLKRAHSIDIESSKKAKDASSAEAGANVQTKLTSFTSRLLHHDSPKAKRIEYKLAKCICRDLQPISVVEDKGFQELIAETTDGKYVMPNRKKNFNK